jgi:hypothetical protein
MKLRSTTFLLALVLTLSLCLVPVSGRSWYEFFFGSSTPVSPAATTEQVTGSTTGAGASAGNKATPAQRVPNEPPLPPNLPPGPRHDNTSHTAARHSLEDHITRTMKEKTTQFGHLTRAVFIGDTTIFQFTMNVTTLSNLEKQVRGNDIRRP